MELPIPDIDTVYGLRPRSIIKSKYFYMITAEKSLYRLYPLAMGEEVCTELAALNKRLCAEGAPVCPIVPTADNEDFAVTDEQFFMLTRVPKGRTPDIETPEDVLKAADALGRVHAVLRGCPVKCAEGLSLPYEKGIRALKNIKSIINRKNKVNETDKMFLQSYDKVLARAEKAAEALCGSGLGCTYAYGMPKEENFILSGKEAFLTNWSSLYISHFLEDAAYFYKRYFKKVKPPLLTGKDILDAYTAQNPLSGEEKNVLESILTYPEKYISVAKEYYGRHRPFAPLYVKEKLNKELAELGL